MSGGTAPSEGQPQPKQTYQKFREVQSLGEVHSSLNERL